MTLLTININHKRKEIMNTTLILNADMQPLSLVPLSVKSWQEAITMVWTGNVSVLEEYENQDKHSPSVTIKLPSVVTVREYQNIKKSVKFSRYGVFLRDMFKCQYCGLDLSHTPNVITLDHYTPRALGGKTTWDNSISACPSCNSKKAHHIDMHKLVKYKPYKPDYWELVGNRKKLPIIVPDASWIPYLGWEDHSLITVKTPR
jgi:5-methylcytosine-specific restriction endonuclease McrA